MNEKLFTRSSFENITKNTRIILNSRGIKYEVLLTNLDKIPIDSRLGKIKSIIEKPSCYNELVDLCDDFNLEKKEFYFDRDPYILNMILNYFVNGQFHINENVCVNLLSKELNYWGLSEFYLFECCSSKYWKKKSLMDEDVKKEKTIIGDYTNKDEFVCCMPKFRSKIWKLITLSEKSILSKVKFRVSLNVTLGYFY